MEHRADLLVGNGRLISNDDRQPFFEDGCVAVLGGMIVAVGSAAELRAAYSGCPFLDAQNRIIIPGLINAHTHLYSAFARGMALKDPAPGKFTEILERLWWRLDKALMLEDVYLSAMDGMIACIRNGVTTIFDHHSSPCAVTGSLFRIAEAARQIGLRSCLCYEVSDRNGAEVAAQGIEENRAFLAHCKQLPDNQVRALFGLHASFTLSDKTLARCREAAAEFNSGFHVHTAEALLDVDECLRRHGRRVVERWSDLGILGNRTLAAHCVHVNDREIDLLRETETNVVHNPESNMNNGVGCAPVLKMMRRGVRVGLGTDGFAPDMFGSMRAATLLQRLDSGDPSAGWAESRAMLLRENAAIASECFGQPVGKLIPGASADIILVDYDSPTPLSRANLNGHLQLGLSGGAVASTIIDGKVVMRDRKLLAVDEAEVMAKARAAASELWKRF